MDGENNGNRVQDLPANENNDPANNENNNPNPANVPAEEGAVGGGLNDDADDTEGVPNPDNAGEEGEEEEEEENEEEAPIINEEEDDMAANVLTPAQSSQIPPYDGTRGDAFLAWMSLVKSTKQSYNWDHKAILRIVELKGGPKVQEWLMGKKAEGKIYDCFTIQDGQPQTVPIETDLYERFGPIYTANSAVTAVSALQQRSDEQCAEFLDRVLTGVTKMFYNVAEEHKGQPGYRQCHTAVSIIMFGAGLRDSIAKVVFSSATQYATVRAILQAAEAAEVEQSKKPTPNHLSALAVQQATPPHSATHALIRHPENPAHQQHHAQDIDFDPNLRYEDLPDGSWHMSDGSFPQTPEQTNFELQQDMHDICMAISSSMDMTKIKCYNCASYGHFARNCPKPRRRPMIRGRGTPRGRFNTRMDIRRRPFGPTRALMAVDHEEADDQDESYVTFEDQTGNE